MALDLPEGSKDGWLDGDGDKVVSYRIHQFNVTNQFTI